MKQVFTVPFENEPAFLKKILSAAGQAGIQTGPSARWEPFRQAVKILLPFFNSFGGSCVGLRDEPSNRFCLRLTAQFLPLSPSCVFYLPEGDSLLAVTARCIGRAGAELSTGAGGWRLEDGLMHFGLLEGSGYFWSLDDHRVRHSYGKHPKNFDELSDIRPTAQEQAFDDIRIAYDNHELEMEFVFAV